jgi:hypothetical protein
MLRHVNWKIVTEVSKDLNAFIQILGLLEIIRDDRNYIRVDTVYITEDFYLQQQRLENMKSRN